MQRRIKNPVKYPKKISAKIVKYFHSINVFEKKKLHLKSLTEV